MRRYTTMPTEARHHIQYDQGGKNNMILLQILFYTYYTKLMSDIIMLSRDRTNIYLYWIQNIIYFSVFVRLKISHPAVKQY